MAVMIGWNFAVDESGIHWIDKRIEYHHVGVPDQNGKGCQHRFIVMDCGRRIRNPLGKMPQQKLLNHNARPETVITSVPHMNARYSSFSA